VEQWKVEEGCRGRYGHKLCMQLVFSYRIPIADMGPLVSPLFKKPKPMYLELYYIYVIYFK